MNKRQKERLLKRADFLATEVPRKHFDMGTFGDGDFKHEACGSAGCALGWATVLFPRSLRLQNYDGRMADVIHRKTGRLDFHAAEEFFGLGFDETLDLFKGVSSDYRTPKQVAQNIRRAVVRIEKEQAKA